VCRVPRKAALAHGMVCRGAKDGRAGGSGEIAGAAASADTRFGHCRTLFQDSHLPLTLVFELCGNVTSQKNGVSAFTACAGPGQLQSIGVGGVK